jgi:hypothetical protein
VGNAPRTLAQVSQSGHSKNERNIEVKRGYKVWATDEQIITAMRDSLRQHGKISRDFVCVQCRCGSKRVNKIAEELGVELPNRRSPRQEREGRRFDIQRGDNTFVHACQEALREGGLDSPLGELLSIITRVPLADILKMAEGKTVNVERKPLQGTISKCYLTSPRQNYVSF